MNKTNIAIALAAAIGLSACDKPADVAARNLSEAADNFEINRRITFMNGMTNQAMLVINSCLEADMENTKYDLDAA